MKKSVQNRRAVQGQQKREKREKKEKIYLAPASIGIESGFSRGRPGGRASWRFPGRELIADVAGSVAFATTRYIINPGLSATFPQLRKEAAQWEQYRFHSLRFVFIPKVGSQTGGSVLLSPDYNVRDLPPSTEVEAADNEDAVECVAWTPMGVSLKPNSMFPFGPRKLVRSSVVPGDMNLYDVGNLYVSTVGEADATTIGKLWVEFDVEFFVQQNSPDDQSGPSLYSQFTRATAQTFTNNVAAAVDFDSPTYNPLQVSEAAGVFTPKAGAYLVRMIGSFNDSNSEAYTATMSIRKNSVAVISAISILATGGSQQLCAEIVVSCNGTDIIDPIVTLQGAVGTLTLKALTASIVFVPA